MNLTCKLLGHKIQIRTFSTFLDKHICTRGKCNHTHFVVKSEKLKELLQYENCAICGIAIEKCRCLVPY